MEATHEKGKPMIRPMETRDLERVMALWLEGNRAAHPFVAPTYWAGQTAAVREQLPIAEVFVYEEAGAVRGFVGLQGDFLAGLFVEAAAQGRGIGRRLLAHAQATHPTLTLSVYRQNTRALAFYQRAGFRLRSEGIDPDTGAPDCLLSWPADAPLPDEGQNEPRRG